MSKTIKFWFTSLTAIAVTSSLFTFCESNTGKFPEESFSIFQATDGNGDVVFNTVNMGYKDYKFKEEFPWYVLIAVETRDLNENGHPTDAEADVLNVLEDSIHGELTKVCQAHHIGRSTLQGYRKIFYYVDDFGNADSTLEVFANDPNPLRLLKFKLEQDESWKKVAYLFG